MSASITHAEDTYTLETGESAYFGQGYSLQAKQIDVDGDLVWLELANDGEYIDDTIISSGKTWTCKNTEISIKVYVDSIRSGPVNSFVNLTISSTVSKPVAAFSASSTSGKVPLTVKFTDKSTNSPTSWKWTFGDGNTSTVQNPTHKYSKIGKYTVKLTVKNAAGSNSVTKSKYITVK